MIPNSTGFPPSPSQPIYLSTAAVITSPTTALHSEPRAPFPATTSCLSAPCVSLQFHFSVLSLCFEISTSKGCVRIRLDLIYAFSTRCLLDNTTWNFNNVSSLIYYWMDTSFRHSSMCRTTDFYKSHDSHIWSTDICNFSKVIEEVIHLYPCDSPVHHDIILEKWRQRY